MYNGNRRGVMLISPLMFAAVSQRFATFFGLQLSLILHIKTR